jgi:hypothetical protein
VNYNTATASSSKRRLAGHSLRYSARRYHAARPVPGVPELPAHKISFCHSPPDQPGRCGTDPSGSPSPVDSWPVLCII